MRKQLDEVVVKFKNSQTSLEAYEAISDFVKIIVEIPEFIKQVEAEGEKIRIAQIELNADKGWTYGLRGRELDEHNENRGKKWETLFQLDSSFQLSELETIHEWFQSENMTDTVLLFQNCKPDDALSESERKRYQGFIDKLYKKVIPFLEKEAIEEITAEVILPQEKEIAEEVATEIILPKNEEVVAWDLDFNSEKSILYIGKYEIKITRRKNNTTGHYILQHIFNSPEGLSEEFSYKEIWEQTINDSMEDFNDRTYYRGCEEIQTKVSQDTNFIINDFLSFDSTSVKINPNYLNLKQ
jgi:hypothetical protein